MGNINIYRTCFDCNGTAIVETQAGSVPCELCDGTGKTFDTSMDDTLIQQIITKLDAIKAKMQRLGLLKGDDNSGTLVRVVIERSGDKIGSENQRN